MHLRPGCTGRIGKLVVVQRSGDGVKVAEGVHDLVVGGGSIRCLAKAPRLPPGRDPGAGRRAHHLPRAEDLVRPPRRTADQLEPLHQAGRRSRLPPRDVVCESCSFGGWAAHTVSVQTSVRSGVTDSTLCVARFPQFTLAVGDGARDPRLSGNQVRQCSPGKLTLEPGPRTVEFGERLQLRGLFLGQLPGSRVVAQARERGTRKFVRADATHSKRNGRFKLTLRPRIGEVVRLRSGSLHGPAFHVRVRPRVVLRRRGSSPRGEGARGPLVRRPHRDAPGPPPRPLGRRAARRARAPLARPLPSRASTGLVRIAVAHTPGYLPATASPCGCRERRDLRRRRLALGHEPGARAAERAQHALDLGRDALLRRPAAAASRERHRAARRR